MMTPGLHLGFVRHLSVAFVAAFMLVSVPGQSSAQGTKKSFAPKTQPKTDGKLLAPKSGRRAARKGPGLGGERFVRKRTEAMAEAKWREAFELLNKLIRATSNSDSAKPDLYFRLSEMFWERASAIQIRAFDNEELCLDSAGGNSAAEDVCVAKRERMEGTAKVYRDKAIKVYTVIVRNFPRYPRLDGVLFALAFNYQQKQEPGKAKKIYVELIKRYPRSNHMPDTLLNIGEIFFEEGNVASAAKAYGKVVSNYQDSDVYGYALYKLGWCHFNQNQHKQALRQFLRVIQYTNKLKQGGHAAKNRIMLAKEAKRDLVRAYVHVSNAKATKAISFFRKVAPDDYLDLVERLADLYGLTGQFQKSNQLYRELIRLLPDSYRVVSFQKQIASNTRSIGQPVKAIQELKRLVTLWRTVKDAKDAKPERVAKDRKGIEELLRQMAVQYHQQALKTKSNKDYAIAYALYDDYVKTFPDGENAYEMTFYFAELLYKLRKWKEAAVNYERALELKKEGEYTKDAAHGAVLAYKKLLNVKQDSKGTTAGSADDEVKEVPKAKPLTEDHVRYIAACDLYSKYVKASEYLVDIEYDAARIYYDFNHFDKAVPRFKNIAERHPNHRVAVFAANLLLDTYNLLHDYKALNAQVDIFLKIYPEQRDPTFYALLIKLKQNSSFTTCRGVEAEKKYREAARCYLNFSARFKGSENGDKALYNAAANLHRARLYEKAIQVGLKLVNEYPNSKIAPKALFGVARALEGMAIFSEAAKAYEYYGNKYPKTDDARDALRRAGAFREGLGQYDKAIADYKGYLRLSKKHPKEAANGFFALGLIYKKQKRWPLVIKHFKGFIKRYNSSLPQLDLVLEAHVQIGNAYMAQNARRNEKVAQKAYKKAYDTFMALPDEQKKGLTTGIAAIAEARFKMGEAVFRRFEANKLKVFPYRNVKKFVKKMIEKIKAKTAIVVEARNIYMEVIKFGSPNWAIAALARIGQMFQQLSVDIYEYPAPASFDEDMVEAFKGTMSDKSQVPESKAISAYVLCLKKAQEMRWFNKWSELSERELAHLNPREYRTNAERRAQPNNFGSATVSKGFILKLPKEDL